eukprot:9470739-Pyramimonas_sp.AAC.1
MFAGLHPVAPQSEPQRDGEPPPPGPDSMTEMFNYVEVMVSPILSGPGSARFVQNLKARVMLTTKYSGMGCEAIALWWIGRAARAAGVDIPGDWFNFHSACDYLPLSQRVLKNFRADVKPKHLFRDILSRHEPQFLQQLLG